MFVTTDLNTLLTALYVKIDDELGRHPVAGPAAAADRLRAGLPRCGAGPARGPLRGPLAAVRARQLAGMFPYLPRQSGYNKRLRAALPLVKQVIRVLAVDTDLWFDNHWIVDSTPVECGRSRPTVKRSDLAGWAGYGYCASPLPVLLGPAPAPGLHPRRDAHPWALADPENRRTRGPDRDARPRTRPGHRTGPGC